MKITYNNKEITLTPEQIKTLGLEKKSYKPWRAEKGANYYYVDSLGCIGLSCEKSYSECDHRYLTGNYFQTKEQAEAHKAKLEAIGRVTHRILELNEGYDYWAELSFTKYWVVIYRMGFQRFEPANCCDYIPALILPKIKSEEIAEQIIKECESDLKLIFGI